MKTLSVQTIDSGMVRHSRYPSAIVATEVDIALSAIVDKLNALEDQELIVVTVQAMTPGEFQAMADSM